MVRRVRLYVSIASLSLVVSIAGASVLRTEEPEVLFEDDFAELDASFAPNPNSKAAVEDHNLVLTAPPQFGYLGLYQSGIFADCDITVRVRLTDPEAEKGAFCGVAFWGLDYSRFYMFMISDSNTAGVIMTGGSQWAYPASWRRHSAIKTGANEWNELRVVTAGNRATLYLNSEKFATIRGKAPEGGGVIGLVHYSGSEESSSRFANLKVVTPSGPDAVVSDEKPLDPDTLYADDFAVFDPGWGQESGQAAVKDNRMVIKPEVEHAFSLYQESVRVTDVDMTVKLRLTAGSPEEGYASAGLIFWSPEWGDFCLLAIDNEGKVGVDRYTKNRWLKPLPYKPIPSEAKSQPDEPYELRVVTNGKKSSMYINGISLGSISGQPLKGDWRFGIWAQSGKAPTVAEFSSFVVRKPASSDK